MRKLPVIATVREAYHFTLEHLGAIIGLIWLPMVIVTVAGFFIEQRYYADAQAALAANNYATMGPAMLGLLFYMIAALLLYAMMYVPVAQLALGLRKGGAVARFTFGPTEWRMFRSILGLILFLLLPVFVLGLASGIAMHFSVVGPGLGSIAMRFVFVLVYFALIFVALRFAFFLPAIVVSEDKAPLARSWSLSAGNFWRILAVLLASIGPVVILAALAQAVMEGVTPLPHVYEASSGGMALAMHAARSNLPLAAGLGFLIAPFLIGLGVGASASAYRFLVRADA